MARPTSKEKRIKQARELLENEFLTEIFDTRESEIYERWKASTSFEIRESCYYEMTALEGLRDAIDATATE